MAKRLTELPPISSINLNPELFNKVYYPLLFKVYEYMVLYGGSGSGKSSFAGELLAVQMTYFPGRNLACLRKQKTDCLKSCFSEIYKYLKKFGLLRYWDVRRGNEFSMTNRVNGNQIIFEGVDSIEDIKSIKFVNDVEDNPGDDNLTDVWYEEVNAEKDVEVIREIDRRLRDPYIKGRIILTFNPVLRTHWLYDYVMNELQMPGVDSLVLKTTYLDNKFRPKSYDKKLERYKYTDPYAYQVFTLGNWGTSGECVFNTNVVFSRLQKLETMYAETPYIIGDFTYGKDSHKMVIEDTIRFVPKEDGCTFIFADRVEKHPYVAAVDTAGEGSNFYAGQVCDNLDGSQVAVFHHDKIPDWCIEQVYCLCCYYNHALYCPETNFDSYPLKYFINLDYPNIYRRVSSNDKTHIRTEDRYGFRTGADNRQPMLTEMKMFTNDYIDLIFDPNTLNEMLTFTIQEKRIKGIWWGAETGAFDDLCFVKGTLILTDKGQIPIENIKIGDMVLTRDGYKPVEHTTSRYKIVITNIGLTGTPNHPIITTSGEKELALVKDSDILYIWNEKLSTIEERNAWSVKQSFTKERSITDIQNPNEDSSGCITGGIVQKELPLHYTDNYGLITLVKSLRDMLFTTKTRTLLTIQSIILNVLRLVSIVRIICCRKNVETNQLKTGRNNQKDWFANLKSGEKTIPKKQKPFILKTVRTRVNGRAKDLLSGAKKIQKYLSDLFKKTEDNHPLKDGERIERVYNLQVFETNEYFANNILVHNCMAYAIMLQARSQQACEMIVDTVKLKGHWTKEELDDALEEGEIDLFSMLEYIESHDLYMESQEVTDYSRITKGAGQYANR